MCVSAAAPQLLQIAVAVQRAAKLAKRESVDFPLSKAFSLPHRIDGYWGAAKVMLRPAAEGAGVIAGVPSLAYVLCLSKLLSACVCNCRSPHDLPLRCHQSHCARWLSL